MQQQIEATNVAIQQQIEAILFACGHDVTYAKLAELLGSTEGQIRQAVQQFAEVYNDPSAGRGLQLVVMKSSCQLSTKPEYSELIRTALGIREGTGRLSDTTMEVLSVIAYHQPTTKAYVEQIRGMSCDYAIASLVNKGFIEPKGRLDAPGRPMLYGTTAEFLRCFGLKSLDELPQVQGQDPNPFLEKGV